MISGTYESLLINLAGLRRRRVDIRRSLSGVAEGSDLISLLGVERGGSERRL